MKKLAIVLVAMMMAIQVFGQGHGQAAPPAPKGPPTFIEEPIPEGKAIIYFYSTYDNVLAIPRGWGSVILFFKGGPQVVLPGSSYFAFVTDPGNVETMIMIGSGGQYGSGIVAKKFVTQAIAGQASFVVFSWGIGHDLGLKVIPAESAKKDNEILYCKKVE